MEFVDWAANMAHGVRDALTLLVSEHDLVECGW